MRVDAKFLYVLAGAAVLGRWAFVELADPAADEPSSAVEERVTVVRQSPSRASMPRSNLALRQLSKRQDELERRLEEKGVEQWRDAKAGVEPLDVEPLDAEEEMGQAIARDDARQQAHEDALASEGRDSQHERVLTAEFGGVLETPSSGNTEIRSISCGTVTCRLELSHDSFEEREGLIMRMMDTLPPTHDAFLRPSKEGMESTVYLTKNQAKG